MATLEDTMDLFRDWPEYRQAEIRARAQATPQVLDGLDLNQRPWQVDNVIRERHAILTQSIERDGVHCWESNGHPVPPDVFASAGWPCEIIQQDAYRAHLDASCERYRAARAGQPLSAEARFEMLAAFGPGETVVDIITGEVYRT